MRCSSSFREIFESIVILVGGSMKKLLPITVLISAALMVHAFGADHAPLKLVQTVQLPGIKKSFDHLTADSGSNRLFVAAEWHSSVEVYDFSTGKFLHSIGGMRRPHAVLYRPDLDRLYVTDGDDDGGMLRIYDGKSYQQIKQIDLLPDTDSIGYDPETKYIYVTNGGEDAKLTYSLVSIIDTTAGEKVGEIKVESDTIGGMRLETSTPRLYLDVPDKKTAKKTIAVIDRDKHSVLENWLVPESKREGALALDEANHRLFVGLIEGLVEVLNTETGKKVTEFPIGKGTDDMAYDSQSKRIYAACEDGTIHVYIQSDADHYKLLGKVASALGARTGRLVSEKGRYFTAAPAQGNAPAKLLIYEVQ
jgi:DNA-binding beta-propeller fold protein YncE